MAGPLDLIAAARLHHPEPVVGPDHGIEGVLRFHAEWDEAWEDQYDSSGW